MQRLIYLVALILFGWSLESLDYGGGKGGETSCPSPKFAQFDPPEMAEVAPGARFSFLTWSVLPETLEVTVKGQKVAVEITPKGPNYLVSGTLPAGLTGPARINVKAYGPGQCLGTSGWLLKIQ